MVVEFIDPGRQFRFYRERFLGPCKGMRYTESEQKDYDGRETKHHVVPASRSNGQDPTMQLAPDQRWVNSSLLDRMGSPYNARHDSKAGLSAYIGLPVEPG
jgi:hypothetical protein